MGKMSQSPKLPVLQPTADQGCGCDRRDVLQGIAVAATLVPMAACRIDDPGAGDDAVDAAPGGDASAPSFTMCGANLCVDLTHPDNAALLTAGGFRVITIGTKKVMVARSTATDFVTMTAVCTHAGCTVRFAPAASQMQCPCHGSKYMLDGTVVVGPALNPLKLFTNDFDMANNLLTVMLT